MAVELLLAIVTLAVKPLPQSLAMVYVTAQAAPLDWVGVRVGVRLGVFVTLVGVRVGVRVGVFVTPVGVRVGVFVILVGVRVGVCVTVAEGVTVFVFVGVLVTVVPPPGRLSFRCW